MARRLLARTLFACATVGLVLVGLLTGMRPLPFLPVPEATFALTSFGAFVFVSGLLFAYRLRRDRRTTPAAIDGTVTAIVPTYRDAAVLDRSVESLLDCDHDVEVVVVCEPDDDESLRVAREYADRDGVECLVNEYSGSKAGAINYAVHVSDGDVFAVFDADQEVPDTFFDDASGHLRDADVVQTRFLPRPTGFVESLVYYEYVLFNYCFRQPLYTTSTFRMATSKALLFTRDAFRTVGGYDPDVVAEDTDFGHRCYLAEQDVRLTYVPAVREEAVHSLRDWWGQRKRWMMGNVQVLVRLLSDLPSDFRRSERYTCLSVAVSSIGGAAFLLSLVPKFAWLVATGGYVAAASPIVAIYAVAATARAVDTEPMDSRWLFAPVVLPVFSLVTLMAVAEYVTGVDAEWFTVEKGES